MDPTFNALSILFGPSLWWLWEAVIVFCYFFFGLVGKMNKAMVIDMTQVKGMWFGRIVYKPQQKSFRMRKGESHTQEQDKIALMMQGTFRTNPVYFYRKKRTRPLYGHFEEIPHSPAKNSYNPAADDWDTFATEETYMQAKKANKTNQKIPLAMLILVALAAGGMAFMLGFFTGNPALLHPGAGDNGAVTSIVSGALNSTSITTTHTYTTSTSTDANGNIHIIVQLWRAIFA